MQQPPNSNTLKKTAKSGAEPSREDRLKAALKANLGRRKAQTKARAAHDGADADQKETE